MQGFAAAKYIAVACVYLGTHSPSRKNVFQDKNSKDRAAAIASVRNAAWDITHLSEFIRLVNQDPDRTESQYLFASVDGHLRLTTRLLLEIAKISYCADRIGVLCHHCVRGR